MQGGMTRYAAFGFFVGMGILMLAAVGCSKHSEATITFSQQFDATLQPRGLQGFEIGPTSSEKCAYVAKICPLEPSPDGAHVQNYYIEPECNGTTWHDVIRIVLPPEASAPLKVHVVIYKISGGEEPPTKHYN